MKKLILLLTIVLVGFSLSSCTNKPVNELISLEKDYDNLQNFELTITTEKETYSADDEVITYYYENQTDKELIFGIDYEYLHKYDNGEWKMVSFKDENKIVDALAFGIPAHSQHKGKLNLEKDFYTPLEEGEYRIVIDDGYFVFISNVFTIK